MRRHLCLCSRRLQAPLKMCSLSLCPSRLSLKISIPRHEHSPLPRKACARNTQKSAPAYWSFFPWKLKNTYVVFFQEENNVCLCLTRTQKVLSPGFNTRQKLLLLFREVSSRGKKPNKLYFSAYRKLCGSEHASVRVAEIILGQKARLESPSSPGRNAGFPERVRPREENTEILGTRRKQEEKCACVCSRARVWTADERLSVALSLPAKKNLYGLLSQRKTHPLPHAHTQKRPLFSLPGKTHPLFPRMWTNVCVPGQRSAPESLSKGFRRESKHTRAHATHDQWLERLSDDVCACVCARVCAGPGSPCRGWRLSLKAQTQEKRHLSLSHAHTEICLLHGLHPGWGVVSGFSRRTGPGTRPWVVLTGKQWPGRRALAGLARLRQEHLRP